MSDGERASTPTSTTSGGKMDQRVVDLLRGQATEFTDQSEKAIEEDPIYTGWDIKLRNCQVMLQGHENTGCMCLTAEKMRWLRHEYKRAWRDGQYLDKFRLKGDLKGMQLFSLTSTDLPDHCLWVPIDQINQEFRSVHFVVYNTFVTFNYATRKLLTIIPIGPLVWCA